MALARRKIKFACFPAFLAVLLLWANLSYAGAVCTPGIPCTNYTITAQPNAGISTNYNGWKTGSAPPFTGSTCDGNYMNQMIGEAYLHARREVAMNEQIIRKPDSIFEYTCFDQQISQVAYAAGPIFSESTSWENRTITLRTNDDTVTETYSFKYPANHLDNVLGLLLLESLRQYMTNFAHTYLGGSAAIDSNMNLTSIVGSGGYNCTEMKAVWDLAHCNNFGADDNFVSFGQLITGDPRQLIAACGGRPAPVIGNGSPPGTLASGEVITAYLNGLDALGVMTITETDPCPAAGNTGVVTANQIRLTNNCDFEYSSYEVARSYFEYFRDPWFPTYDLIAAATSAIPAPLIVWGLPCGKPIPTGVKIPTYVIQRYTDPLTGIDTSTNIESLGMIPGLDYEEHICVNPGCSYIPGVGECAPPLP